MAERTGVLASYRCWLAERWRDGHLSIEDLRALKVFAEVHRLTAQEHEAAADAEGVDRRELVDENSQHFADWLAARRRPLPAGSGALSYAPPAVQPWKIRLQPLPLPWQNALAGLAAFVALASLVIAVVAH